MKPNSVDTETEAITQGVIDSEFKDSTVIAVMHHQSHIIRYDKVALLEDGHLIEFDAPQTLLQNSNSRFSRLYRTSGASLSA
ncbi:hypothetical protein F5X97DRAFT_296910 [Nemania serpens]|nr:hypothetical protein F5X97DRAFT_296910 [Nemania serpens]